MEKKYEGVVTLNGVEYPCSVVNGERLINGLNSDQFISYLEMIGDWKAIGELAFIGQAVIKNNF